MTGGKSGGCCSCPSAGKSHPRQAFSTGLGSQYEQLVYSLPTVELGCYGYPRCKECVKNRLPTRRLFLCRVGLTVWWSWSSWPKTQGIVRMQKVLLRGEEVLVPVVEPVRPQERGLWVADLPNFRRASYRDGDLVTVIVRKKGIVKPPISVSMSPSTDFAIGAVFFLAGWRLSRTRSSLPAKQSDSGRVA